MDPDFTCTPYKVIRSYNYQYTNTINYGPSFTTKADAINATLTSLTDCLNGAGGGTNVTINSNYVVKYLGNIFTTQNYDPTRIAYNNNFNTKSACIIPNPANGSDLWVANSNTCTYLGRKCLAFLALSDACLRSVGVFNGVSREIDYTRTLPETMHLNTLRCNNSVLPDVILPSPYSSLISKCSVDDIVVPTYQYTGDLNLQISAMSNGFRISWDDISAKIGAAVNYNILKKDSRGNYSLIKNTTDTSFSDTAFDPSQTQYYEVDAYNFNNSFINMARVDSSNIKETNSLLIIHGAGFTPAMLASTTISLKISSSNPNASTTPNIVIPCSGFQFQDEYTLVNGICNIDPVNDPSGAYDVVLNIDGHIYTLPAGFTITYPLTINTAVQGISTDVSDGYLKIKSVQGTNLNSLSIVSAQTVDGYVDTAHRDAHYTLGSNDVNPDTKTFSCTGGESNCTSDGYMKIYIGDLLSKVNGDLSKIQIFTAGDFGSEATVYSDASGHVSLKDLGIGCVHNSDTSTWIQKWTPAINNTCPVNYSEAVDNCGVVQPAVQGTLSCQQNYLCDSTLNKCVPDPSFCTKDYVLNNLCKGYNCGSPIDLCGNSPWSCGSCSSKQGTCKVYAGGGGICGGN